MDYLLQDNQRKYEISDLRYCLEAYSNERAFFVITPIYTLTDYMDLWGQFCIDNNLQDSQAYKEHQSNTELFYFNNTKISTFQSLALDYYLKFKEWCLQLRFKKDGILYDINAVIIRGTDPVDKSKLIELTVFIPKAEQHKLYTYIKDSLFTIETTA